MNASFQQLATWAGVLLGLAAHAAGAAHAGAALLPPGQRAWAFTPVPKVEPPPDPSGWAANAIDRFIRSRLREHGLEPAGLADKRTLIRRLTFDLTGLPPTPEEVEAFVHDPSPDAYE